MYVNNMDKKVHDRRGNAKLENLSSKMILMRPEGGSIISTRGRMYKLLMESRIERKKMKMMAQLHVVKQHAANREWVTVVGAQWVV